MKSPFYRRMMALTLAMGVAACGGKASFEIKGQVVGLKYDGLVLTDVASGNKLTIAGTANTFAFPNSIDYGTPYDVQIVATGPVLNQPAHQNCSVLNGKDTAGRLSTINIIVRCLDNVYPLGGSITIANAAAVPGGEVTGLTLSNGSVLDAVVAAQATVSYTFPSIPFGTTYGVIIAKQPTVVTNKPKVTCVLDTAIVTPPGTGMTPDKLSFNAKMGDAAAVVNVICTAAP